MDHSLQDDDAAKSKASRSELEEASFSKPTLVVIHGMGEHSGRYGWIEPQIARLGWQMLAIDLPGHGKSPGRRGDVQSYECLLDEVAKHWQQAARNGKPTRIWGHSFGGNLVVNQLLRRGRLPGIESALVTGPMFRTARPAPLWKRIAARTLSGIWPTLTVRTGIDARELTRDPQEVAAYRSDPLNHGLISARLGKAMLDSGAWALNHAADWNRATGELPLQIWHGEADGITSCAASRQFAAAAGDSVRFEAWPEARHELHHDLCRPRFLDQLCRWLSGD